MAGTFSQIYIQAVFAVKDRQPLVQNEWKSELYSYIGGIIKAEGNKPIIINGMADHIHIFFGLKPVCSVSKIIGVIKSNSTNFINDHKMTKTKFAWQQGYGAFSYGHSQIDDVYQYVKNQGQHHEKKTFQEEYIQFMDKFGIEYDLKYLFD